MPTKAPASHEPRPCKICGAAFRPSSSRQVMCSGPCRAADLKRCNDRAVARRKAERAAGNGPAPAAPPRPPGRLETLLRQPVRPAQTDPAPSPATISLEPGMIEAVRAGIEHGTIRRYGFFLVIKGAGDKPVALVPDQSGPPSIKKGDVLGFVKRRPDGRWAVKTTVEGVQIWDR